LLPQSAAVANYAIASDWERIDKTPEGEIYIHSSSIYNGLQGKGGDKKKVRTLMSYHREQTNIRGERFYSMEFLDELSCAKRVRTTLASIQYQGKLGTGKVVKTHKVGVAVPEPIRSGTVDQLILGEANCNLMTGIWDHSQ
jgi:uncharacterized protein (UPF0335 family)